MLELEIDGKKTSVQEGTMVLEAANQLGITIPYFCYHHKLSIAANCRMCLVEVEKMPKPMPACATPVTAGMVVRTQSEKAKTAQKAVMEFLLINHPLDCPICDQGGECQLQDLSLGYGHSQSRYNEEKRVVFHKNVGPLISMEEMSRCIHCTRCVRFGQEIAGIMELGMQGRGEHSEITTFIGHTVDSELSGNMIDVCPVGALTSKPFRYQARTWELARHRSISPHDSLGSHIEIQSKSNKVLRVLPLENEQINECWLSDRDRFSYEGLNSEERLTTPRLKLREVWRDVDWEQSLSYISHHLSELRHANRAHEIVVYAHPQTTLEEFFLLDKLLAGLNHNQHLPHIEFRFHQQDFNSLPPSLGCAINEIENLASVLVVGSYLRHEQPLLAARLRQAARKGKEINLLHQVDDNPLIIVKNQWLSPATSWLRNLAEIYSAICQIKNHSCELNITPCHSAQAIAQSLVSAGDDGNRVGLFLGEWGQSHSQSSVLFALLRLIAKTLGGSVVGQFTPGANTLGGHIALKKLPSTPIHSLKPSVVILWHTELADLPQRHLVQTQLKEANLVIAASPFNHTDNYADVVLPIAPFTETAGTFVNLTGHPQSFSGVVTPLANTRPGWKVLRVLANLLELPGFEYSSNDEVRQELLQNCDIIQAISLDRYPLPTLSSISFEETGSCLNKVGIYQGDGIVRRAKSLQSTNIAQL